LTVEHRTIDYEGVGLSVENVEVLPLSLLDFLGVVGRQAFGFELVC
jgi:hypothetical protein